MECRDSLLPQYIEPVSDDDERSNPVINEYGIKVGIFPSWPDEARRIVKKAKEFIDLYPDKTIAILAPSAWKIKEIVKILDSWDLPYEQLDNSSPERNKTVRMLGRFIDYIAYPEDGEKLANMMFECFLTERYDADRAQTDTEYGNSLNDNKENEDTESDENNNGDKKPNQKEMLLHF